MVGLVGSGKSTLIAAILGQLEKRYGNVNVLVEFVSFSPIKISFVICLSTEYTTNIIKLQIKRLIQLL